MFQTQRGKNNLRTKQRHKKTTATPTPEAKNSDEPRNKVVGIILVSDLEWWMGEAELTGVVQTQREKNILRAKQRQQKTTATPEAKNGGKPRNKPER